LNIEYGELFLKKLQACKPDSVSSATAYAQEDQAIIYLPR